MINLSNLKLSNFFSHVDTNLCLKDYEGLVLIEGKNSSGHYSSNGSGKSTLLEGIVYALTGDTLRGVSVNDVINRNYKKNTKASLQFMKDGVSYEVSRYRKDDKFGDSLVLQREGEDISKRVNKETQKSLEDILSISYKVLVSTILLGEGLSARFTQLSDPEKKSLIESTLNLNYDISKIRESANNELKKLRLESATLEGEIKTLQEFSNLDIDQLQDEIYDEKECIKVYDSTLESLNEESNILALEINSITPKLNLIRDTINRINILSKNYTDIMSTNAHYQEERDRVLKSESPVCNMCRQALQSAESMQSVLDNYDNMIKEGVDRLTTIDNELSNLPDKNLLESKLSALETEFKNKMQRSRDISQEITRYSTEKTVSLNNIANCEGMIKESLDCNVSLEEKISKHRLIVKSIDKYDYFYKLFSPTGIIVNILSDAIEYINSRLTVYSEVLLEKDYKINFVKGKISLVDSKGSSYQSLSNGEKRRLDIAIQFALHDYVHTYCGNSVDTMYIDEILDTLDDVGIENIITVLRLKLEYCKLARIFVISHNSELKSYFDNVITIVKDGGDSKLV